MGRFFIFTLFVVSAVTVTTTQPFQTMSKERRLAYLLRHDASYPFDEHGWRTVQDLIEHHGFTKEELDDIVATSNKQRFEFSDDHQRIRARQGHSIDVDVESDETEPPEFLFHGTVAANIQSIKEQGLRHMSRQFVHLSSDRTTALQVGRRRKGDVVILTVMAHKMWNDGHLFFLSRNGVWLVKAVPPQYIKLQY